MASIEIEFYNNPNSKYAGIIKNKSCIRINTAICDTPMKIKKTVVHESVHLLLHMGRKHYSPKEKEYQAFLVEYNYCKARNIPNKSALFFFNKNKKELIKENRNLRPLIEEVRRIYPEILRISSLSWQPYSSTTKNFVER